MLLPLMQMLLLLQLELLRSRLLERRLLWLGLLELLRRLGLRLGRLLLLLLLLLLWRRQSVPGVAGLRAGRVGEGSRAAHYCCAQAWPTSADETTLKACAGAPWTRYGMPDAYAPYGVIVGACGWAGGA